MANRKKAHFEKRVLRTSGHGGCGLKLTAGARPWSAVPFDTCHRPPRRVTIPRSFSSAAISGGVIAPYAWMVSTSECRPAAKLIRVSCHSLPQRLAALASPPEGRGTTRVAQLHCAGLRGRQCLLRPPGDRLPFLLGDERSTILARRFLDKRGAAAPLNFPIIQLPQTSRDKRRPLVQ